MYREPAGPDASPRSAAHLCGAEAQDAEDQKVRVGWPSEDGEGGHGQAHDNQTPIVDGAGRRMPAGTLRSPHGHDPRQGTDQPRDHVDRHEAQE